MASLFGCRRRTQTKIPVLPWLLGINHLPPSSSRTFWGQHHWSGNAGSCVDYTWNIFLHLPCGKQFQYFFNSQQWFDTWRSRIKRQTICILLAYWPKGRRSSRSRKYWLFCAASCSIHAKIVEKASGHSILDWYWSRNHQRRIEILSNEIQCNYPSRSSSTKLHCESWKIERRRAIVHKTIFVASSTTENRLEKWSRLDKKGRRFGFYSWTSTSWETCSTVTWRNSSSWFFQANPIPQN